MGAIQRVACVVVLLVSAVDGWWLMDRMFSMNEASISDPVFFLQVDDSPAYVEVPTHRIPISTKTIKTIKASKSKCKAKCNTTPGCKGFKYTEGSDACVLLGHDEPKVEKKEEKPAEKPKSEKPAEKPAEKPSEKPAAPAKDDKAAAAAAVAAGKKMAETEVNKAKAAQAKAEEAKAEAEAEKKQLKKKEKEAEKEAEAEKKKATEAKADADAKKEEVKQEQ